MESWCKMIFLFTLLILNELYFIEAAETTNSKYDKMMVKPLESTNQARTSSSIFNVNKTRTKTVTTEENNDKKSANPMHFNIDKHDYKDYKKIDKSSNQHLRGKDGLRNEDVLYNVLKMIYDHKHNGINCNRDGCFIEFGRHDSENAFEKSDDQRIRDEYKSDNDELLDSILKILLNYKFHGISCDKDGCVYDQGTGSGDKLSSNDVLESILYIIFSNKHNDINCSKDGCFYEYGRQKSGDQRSRQGDKINSNDVLHNILKELYNTKHNDINCNRDGCFNEYSRQKLDDHSGYGDKLTDNDLLDSILKNILYNRYSGRDCDSDGCSDEFGRPDSNIHCDRDGCVNEFTKHNAVKDHHHKYKHDPQNYLYSYNNLKEHDHYDGHNKLYSIKLPIKALETPKNGIKGKLYFRFTPLNKNSVKHERESR